MRRAGHPARLCVPSAPTGGGSCSAEIVLGAKAVDRAGPHAPRHQSSRAYRARPPVNLSKPKPNTLPNHVSHNMRHACHMGTGYRYWILELIILEHNRPL
jgi:hypothetical protein